MPKKFALGDVMVEGMGLKMPFGDGLKDAIWSVTESCRGMGLTIPSGNVELYVIGEWTSIRKVTMFWNIFELGV